MNKEIKAGQFIKVTGDTFELDPHGLPVGSVYEVVKIQPEVRWEEIDPFTQLLLIMDGKENLNVPERLFVKTGLGKEEYANLTFEDVEVVDSPPKATNPKVEMLSDDWSEGYIKGDVFETFTDEDGDLVFYDKDQDIRLLEAQEYKFV